MRTSGRLSIAAAIVALGSLGFVAFDSTPAAAQFSRGAKTGLSIFEGQRNAATPSSYLTTATVERLLAVNGLPLGRVDGIIDQDTRQSIRVFQRRNGLADTGRVDLELITSLASHALDLVPGSELQLSIPPGASSIIVDNILRANRARAQRILARNGFEPGRIDGSPVRLTEDAVRDFQSRAGLPITGQVSPELVAALDEFDRFASRQIPEARRTGVLNRPGFAADNQDDGNLGEGWALRTIANAQLNPVGGIAGAVRMDGFLVASQLIENTPIFSFAAANDSDDLRPGLGFDRVALNWGGFLQIDITGPYEFALQVSMIPSPDSGFCTFVLMLVEDGLLFKILHLRLEAGTGVPERASVFLEQGLHQIELWTQCDKASTNDDFALNLLMRGAAESLQPIRNEFILASETENFFIENSQ
ncbi:MAG: peptidoglycan-binding domain-containing protein [Alphaproteobacteria bacterium]|nr:peptidoglycan-binding domain-containing protein [Alphaproteobacteria bacterium]